MKRDDWEKLIKKELAELPTEAIEPLLLRVLGRAVFAYQQLSTSQLIDLYGAIRGAALIWGQP